MRTRLAWLVLCGLFLTGCADKQKQTLELELSRRNSTVDSVVIGEDVFDSSHGEIQQARRFSEGLAAVRINDRWGFVDTTGNVRIPAVFDEVRDFLDGLATVRLMSRYGVLGMDGRYVFRPVLEGATVFSDSLGVVVAGERSYLVNLKAGRVSRLKSDLEGVGVFYEGLALVKQGDRFGFIDTLGQLVIPCRYEQVRSFQEGLCTVKIDGHWGYIDRTGRMVIEPKYLFTGDFYEGLAAVYLDSAKLAYKGIMIDTLGNQVTEHRSFALGYMIGGIVPVGAALKRENSELEVVWGYWKPRQDDLFTGPDFSYAMSFSNGYAAVRKGNKWGLIDTTGILRTVAEYDTVTSYHNNRSLVSRDGVWGILSLVNDTVCFQVIGGSEK